MAKKKQLNKLTARFLSNQPYATRNAVIIPPHQTMGPVPAGATSLYPGNVPPPPPPGVVVWQGRAEDIDPQHERVDFILRTWVGVCLMGKSTEQVMAEEDAYRSRYPKRFPTRQ